MAGSMDAIETFWAISVWLRGTGMTAMLDLELSALTFTSSRSIQTFCAGVNAAVAGHVVTVTIPFITVSNLTTIPSPLTDLSRRHHLITTLNSSKDEVSTRGRDLHIQWHGCLCGSILSVYGVLAFISMLWLPMRALDPFVRFPQVFGLSECCLAASLAVFTSFVTLWPSVHVLNASAWSPMLFGSSEHDVALPAGVIICMHMFSMRGWFLDLSVSFARPFAPMVLHFGSTCSECLSRLSTHPSRHVTHPFGLQGHSDHLHANAHLQDVLAVFHHCMGFLTQWIW
ncbi:hypothetical protein SCLCIDRAFT_30707 [Scleroderma citrinum Foug A]|uniref:Transmembrane protein n=1 Tax=Scleroderma citrinum Foug A TaxID=1036808 RepID=A0A0C2ZQX4_9AGAM|nr:hypothetical protein SCLCIDRAFT_30707 [Scleroderma citrinum Foug A]